MNQIQLSETQTTILSAACAREGGFIFPVTASIKGGAVGNVCKSLLKHGLVEEIVASDADTVWRHDGARGPITLRATSLAYSTLGITNGPNDTASVNGAPAFPHHRKGTKQARLIEMLRAPDGATIEEIMAATGWLSHTSRGVMSGALKKKLGLTITSEKVEARGRCYRIIDK